MELVANVWPVVDVRTGSVLRFFMRAYLLPPSDAVISTTLRALSGTDFRLATMFAIPERFTLVSEFGGLEGCVTIDDFRHYLSDILEPAMASLEGEYAELQVIGMLQEKLTGISHMPRFPAEPYLVITPLLEMPDGTLHPQDGSAKAP